MAQDPEPEEEQAEADDPHTSIWCRSPPPIRFTPKWRDVIKSILDANGFPSMIVGATGYPSLGYEVMVPRALVEEARRLIEEQRKAGPQAAAEAEAAGEETK
jgi:hypothetical protein